MGYPKNDWDPWTKHKMYLYIYFYTVILGGDECRSHSFRSHPNGFFPLNSRIYKDERNTVFCGIRRTKKSTGFIPSKIFRTKLLKLSATKICDVCWSCVSKNSKKKTSLWTSTDLMLGSVKSSQLQLLGGFTSNSLLMEFDVTADFTQESSNLPFCF